MIRDICRDESFLAQKAEPAAADDLGTAQDLLDSEAGQDVMELAQYFDVLYVDTAASDADLSALRHALAETDCRLGLLAPAGSARSDETLDVIVKQP